MSAKFEVWITKYCTGDGIIHTTAKVCEFKSMIAYKRGAYECYAHGEGKDWHRTLEGAQKRARIVRAKKIASLKKQIAELEKEAPVVDL